MTGLNTSENKELPDVAAAEQRLAAALDAAADEIAHVESFDPEQRAEVYAIISALRNETNQHQDQAAALAGRYVKDGGRA